MADYERLESLFHECAGVDRSEWDSKLEVLPADDRTRLCRLLESDLSLQDQDEDSFLSVVEKPLLEDTVIPSEPAQSTHLTGGQPSVVRDTLEQIGDYRVLNLLAVHGQGAVYRANHPHLNRQVVIKVSKNQLDKASQQAVLEEGRALAALSHPNLAAVYDLQFQDGFPYLVMEYIEGRNLAETLRDNPLPPSEAADLIATLARAIHHAHEVGIVHRDLKPANVVVRAADKTPKIIDFGLAKTRTAYGQDSLSSTYGGTIAYMAPEQAQQLLSVGHGQPIEPTDERVDIFALGAILYQLLTGNRLYTFANQLEGLQLAAECKFDASRLDDVPGELRATCLKALATDPAERFCSALELAEAVQPAAVSVTSTSKTVAVATAVVVPLLCFAIWFAFSQLDKQTSNPDTNRASGSAPLAGEGNEKNMADVAALLPGTRFTHVVNAGDTGYPGRLFENGPVREDDDLRVEVRFNEPMYCFLFALNPDGAVQLCYPHPAPITYEETRDLVQAEPITELKYPADEEEGFPFSDGAGQQGFVLVWSKAPLPSFNEWSGKAGNLKDSLAGTTGRWIFVDRAVRPWTPSKETRGAPRKLRGFEPFDKVMKAIQVANPDYGVSGLSFPVEPR